MSAEPLRLERFESLDAARADWLRLQESSRNVFATFEWAEAWTRHLGAGRELILVGCRRGGEVVALLPLCVARSQPVRMLRFVGYGPADQLGPVCAEGDRAAVADALARTLGAELRGGGLFLGERLAGDQHWAQMLSARIVRHAASPVLPVEGRSFDDFLAGRSRNFREQVRRRARKLARESEMVIRAVSDPGELEADFETLVRLHGLRWEGRATTFDGALGDFHRDFARRALEHGWLRLLTLEIDGEPAASWYGLRFAGADVYYQAGRDPRFDDRSAGFVLLSHSIRQAFDDGMLEYRFGLGDEPYKDRFAERDAGLDTVALGYRLRGRVALSGVATVPRLPAPVRRRLIGIGG